MSGGGLNLDVAAGQAATSSIKGIVGDMRAVIGKIKASAASGLTDWQGNAAKSFDGTHTDWHATAVRLEQALNVIEGKLTSGFRGYDDADGTAATVIVNSAGGLDL
ncbi:WXG100 family type VII secretion target [Gordonia iterans]|uniref:WXG100 family type VII secretion target n=1 Tax=Gordonia iterans TaxID=1004901 RepID=A0A2S0KIJ7_9ACTN|nr:WXG100 family type VII secretion target [Gordonia iterans]AVM01471.1 WXG100 family type VII secretion target [Gordonia iterans]